MMLGVVSFTGDYTPAFTGGLSVKKKTTKLSLTDPWRWRVGIILALAFLPLVVPQGWSNIFLSVALNYQSYFHVFSQIILDKY